MFNSPNTAAMMGVVPAHRRGVAAGARTLLQNTGAVLSIAFVMAIVTSAIPKATLFAIFSGVSKGLSAAKLAPFIANMHVALWVLAAVSFLGLFVCLLRPSHVTVEARARTPRGGTAIASEAAHPERLRSRASASAVGAPPMRSELRRSADRAQPAHRRPRAPCRHHAPHDPLLRGDRPAARRPARPSGSHRLYTTPRSSGCAR